MICNLYIVIERSEYIYRQMEKDRFTWIIPKVYIFYFDLAQISIQPSHILYLFMHIISATLNSCLTGHCISRLIEWSWYHLMKYCIVKRIRSIKADVFQIYEVIIVLIINLILIQSLDIILTWISGGWCSNFSSY